MAACVASPSSWTSSLPYAPHQARHTPLRSSSATWNTRGLDLPVYTSSAPSTSYVPAKPRLRLPILTVSSTSEHLPSRRFDPFADEPIASTSALPPQQSQSQNTPPLARGRALTPLCVSSPLSPPPAPSTPSTPVTGRRRSPSFSAGSGTTPRGAVSLSTLSALSTSPATSLSWAPSPPPSLARSSSCINLRAAAAAAAPPPPAVPLAPTPFHARQYPTPDARARLLARTLLNRIHAVGRPRSGLYSCASKTLGRSNGYESECGARGYVPSRLSECVTVC